jgi:hypothetical protein
MNTSREAYNKRKMERFSLEIPAHISFDDEYGQEKKFSLVTNDVCAGGAFLKTEKPLPIGTEVKIDLVLPLESLRRLEGKKARIEVSGAVIRIDENGMAISFNSNYRISSESEYEDTVH